MNLSKMNKQFINSLKKGDVEAFQALIAEYQSRLYNFAFSLTKSKYISEEIFQEVFIKIWVNRHNLNSDLNLNAYIFKIAKNLILNHLRKVANQDSLKENLWNNITQVHSNTEESIVLKDYLHITEQIIQKLPEQKKNIFILSKFEGKTNEEIAVQLGIKQKTVKNHLWKSTQFIKEQLQYYLTDSAYSILIIFSIFF